MEKDNPLLLRCDDDCNENHVQDCDVEKGENLSSLLQPIVLREEQDAVFGVATASTTIITPEAKTIKTPTQRVVNSSRDYDEDENEENKYIANFNSIVIEPQTSPPPPQTQTSQKPKSKQTPSPPPHYAEVKDTPNITSTSHKKKRKFKFVGSWMVPIMCSAALILAYVGNTSCNFLSVRYVRVRPNHSAANMVHTESHEDELFTEGTSTVNDEQPQGYEYVAETEERDLFGFYCEYGFVDYILRRHPSDQKLLQALRYIVTVSLVVGFGSAVYAFFLVIYPDKVSSYGLWKKSALMIVVELLQLTTVFLIFGGGTKCLCDASCDLTESLGVRHKGCVPGYGFYLVTASLGINALALIATRYFHKKKHQQSQRQLNPKSADCDVDVENVVKKHKGRNLSMPSFVGRDLLLDLVVKVYPAASCCHSVQKYFSSSMRSADTNGSRLSKNNYDDNDNYDLGEYDDNARGRNDGNNNGQREDWLSEYARFNSQRHINSSRESKLIMTKVLGGSSGSISVSLPDEYISDITVSSKSTTLTPMFCEKDFFSSDSISIQSSLGDYKNNYCDDDECYTFDLRDVQSGEYNNDPNHNNTRRLDRTNNVSSSPQPQHSLPSSKPIVHNVKIGSEFKRSILEREKMHKQQQLQQQNLETYDIGTAANNTTLPNDDDDKGGNSVHDPKVKERNVNRPALEIFTSTNVMRHPLDPDERNPPLIGDSRKVNRIRKMIENVNANDTSATALPEKSQIHKQQQQPPRPSLENSMVQSHRQLFENFGKQNNHGSYSRDRNLRRSSTMTTDTRSKQTKESSTKSKAKRKSFSSSDLASIVRSGKLRVGKKTYDFSGLGESKRRVDQYKLEKKLKSTKKINLNKNPSLSAKTEG